MTEFEFIAGSEDELLIWVKRDARRLSRRRAAKLVAAEGYDRTRARHLKITAKHMRPFDQAEDCDAAQHGYNDDGEPRDDDCRCYLGEEEAWSFECSASHSKAQPVWRIEERSRPLYWRFYKARSGYWQRHRYRYVLWGGKPLRQVKSLWVARHIYGGVVVIGDYQIIRRNP